MPHYVDGFVIPVPKNKVEAYRSMAAQAAVVWMDHGALEFRECVGDDLAIENCASFPAMANAKPDETVFFSWIVYASREERDRINAAVMKDERMNKIAPTPNDMPFDCKRMIVGGFVPIVEA